MMFSDESTFTLRGVSKMVLGSSSASRYDPKFAVKTVKHPGNIIMWGAFSKNLDRAALYFLKM